MDNDKVIETINKGMDGLKGDLQKEIEEKIDGKTGEKFKSVEDELKGIHEKLDEAFKAGESHKDESVKELEKRLEEAEQKHAEITEKVRLLTVGGNLNKSGKPDPMKGFFFDREELANRLRGEAFGGGTKGVSSDLFTSGGQLPAEAIDGFWASVIDQTPTLKLITNRSMLSGTGTVDELVISSRSLTASTEGTAITDPDAVSFNRRTITVVEMGQGIDITKTFLEDNVERENAEQLIIDQIAAQFGNDVEDLGWNGDDDSSTTFLAINDGWITLATADSNVNDVTSYDSGATCSDVMHDWKKSVPTKYKMRPDLTFFVPYAFAENYANEVSARETAMGDQVLINGLPALRYFGHPVVAVPYLTSTTGMLTPAKNLYHAYRRNVTIESEWQPRKRIMEITLTVRNDYEYAAGGAIVLGTSIPADLVS